MQLNAPWVRQQSLYNLCGSSWGFCGFLAPLLVLKNNPCTKRCAWQDGQGSNILMSIILHPWSRWDSQFWFWVCPINFIGEFLQLHVCGAKVMLITFILVYDMHTCCLKGDVASALDLNMFLEWAMMGKDWVGYGQHWWSCITNFGAPSQIEQPSWSQMGNHLSQASVCPPLALSSL